MKDRSLTTMLAAACLLAVLPGSVVLPRATAAEPPKKADPVMTEELMGRLIKRTMESQKEVEVPANVCAILRLTTHGEALPSKQVSHQSPEGKYIFVVLLKKRGDEVLLARVSEKSAQIYMTDKLAFLRAAIIEDANGLRMISRQEGAENFRAALGYFAKLAEKLPPAETATPSKKRPLTAPR